MENGLKTVNGQFGEWSKFWPVSALAVALSIGANVLIYLVASTIGAIPANFIIPNVGAPLTLVPVIISSLIGALLAVASFALLARFTKNPFRIFTILALIVLVASLATPLSIKGAPVGLVISLELMHLVEGVILIGLLTRRLRKQAV